MFIKRIFNCIIYFYPQQIQKQNCLWGRRVCIYPFIPLPFIIARRGKWNIIIIFHMRKQVQRDKTIYPRRRKQGLDVEFPPAPGHILSVLRCTGSRAPVLCLRQAGGLQCSLSSPLKLPSYKHPTRAGGEGFLLTSMSDAGQVPWPLWSLTFLTYKM